MCRIIKIFCLSFLFFILPFSLQAFRETGVNNNLIAKVNPVSPGPGEAVTISLTSYGFDINESTVSWYINKVLKSRQIGKKDFTFNLGGVGEQTEIMVYVQSSGGQNATKTFIFDPTEIELLWEANTSEPPFYKGKSLPSAGADIKVFASPYLVNRSGEKLDSDDLIFNWKKNGVLASKLSGQGKNSAIFNTDPQEGQLKIEVEVISPEDNLSASQDLIINLVKPEIVFYEKKPLEGINYGQILPKEYSLYEDEVTIRAEPYFFPLSTFSSLKPAWLIDQSSAIGREDDPFSITLRQNKEISGSNRLDFSLGNSLQTASNYFIIKYGNLIKKP